MNSFQKSFQIPRFGTFGRNVLVALQIGDFCLPTLSQQTQQLHICTPVSQTDLQNTCMSRVLAWLQADAHLRVMFLPSPCLCSQLLRLWDRLGMRA